MVHTFDVTVRITLSQYESFREYLKLKETCFTPEINEARHDLKLYASRIMTCDAMFGAEYYSEKCSKAGINNVLLLKHRKVDPKSKGFSFDYYIKICFNLSTILGDLSPFLADDTYSTNDIIESIYKALQSVPELCRLKLNEKPLTALLPNRVDFAEDVTVSDPHLIAWLANMSVPYKHYKMKRTPINKPTEQLYTESCSFFNSSRAFNFYCKYDEVLSGNKPIDPKNTDRLKQTFRFEIQCKKRSITHLITRQYKTNNYNLQQHDVENDMSDNARTSPLEILLNEDFCRSYIIQQLDKIFKSERYVSKTLAMKIIDESTRFSKADKEIMKSIIVSILRFNGLYNLEKAIEKGIATKQYGKDLNTFRKWLRKIRSLGIQPIVIPDEYGINEIPCFRDLILHERTNDNE